jgi:hypothetical protein
MNTREEKAINRKGLNDAFAEDEMRKSSLILEANLLRTRGEYESATDRFAEAAQIEERLSKYLLQEGLLDKYFTHQFSALSCWAQAGNIYQAIAMGEELLAREDLPERLRKCVQEYVQLLHARRTRWFAEFVPPTPRAVGMPLSQ